MKMLFGSAADAATLTATPDMRSTLPVTNLQNEFREMVARTSSLAPQDVAMVWVDPTPISACVLYRNNLSSAATMRFRVYDEPTMGVLLYDSGTISADLAKPFGELWWGVDPLGASYFDAFGYSVAWHWLPAPVVGKYAVLTLNDPANTDGYIQASRLFVGMHWASTYPPMNGIELTHDETTKVYRTEGGSVRSEAGAVFRRLRIAFDKLPEVDRARIVELLRTVGLRGDVYVSVFDGLANAYERDYQGQFKLETKSPSVINRYSYIDQEFVFVEV
ncbi:MAG: hypothetical protein IT518_02770 [Burkholderiales bacterium]|nr:hypothetical protein [Burkholderiales bacterium]